MPQFTYNAMDNQGNTVQGSVSADDMILAADQVRSMGYKPTSLQLVADLTLPDTRYPTSDTLASASSPPLDLTQAIGRQSDVASALLIPLNDTSDSEEEEEDLIERLEPWQRGGPIPPPPPPQTISAAAPSLDQTQPIMQGTGNREEGRGKREEESNRQYPTPYKEATPLQRLKEIFIYPLRSGVVVKDLAAYYRQFATLINAGLPLYQTLVALEANTNNTRLKEITRIGQNQVSAGRRFSDVMAAYPWVFPEMHYEMVRAAEQGGMLDRVLLQLADYTDHELAMRRLISMETFYPKLVLFAALMMLGGHFFLDGTPAVSKLVLGSMGKNSYTFADYFGDTIGFGFMLALPFILAIVVFRLFLFNIKGVRESYDTFKTSLPSLGNVIKMFALAKFMRTYAALYKGGFPISSTLQIAGQSCGNVLLRNAAYNAVPSVERGGLVSDALARSGFLPPMALNMIRTGETTGGMDDMLDKIADFYEGEAKVKARVLALIFSVGVLLLVGLLVGVAVIRFYMGYAGGISSGGGE